MKRSVHRSIVETIESEVFDYQECLKVLVAKFPAVRHEALCSILSQEHQKRVKRSFGAQTSAVKRRDNYRLFTQRLRQKKEAPPASDGGRGIIVDIARANRFSATLTAKALLVDHLTEQAPDGKEPSKKQVSALMNDTNLIEVRIFISLITTFFLMLSILAQLFTTFCRFLFVVILLEVIFSISIVINSRT